MSQRLNLELPNYFLMYSKIEQRKTLQSNHASAHSSVQLHPWQRIFGAVKSFLFFWTRCSPSGEQQFWEFHVTSTGTLLGVCSRSALQNMWMKGMRFKAPPSPFLFGGGPGGCEWSLTDGKQAVWPINLSLLWLRELSVWVWRKKAGGGREELVQWVNFMNNCIPWFLRTNRWELWDWNCLHAKKGLNSCTVSFGFKWKIMLQKEFCIKERSKTVVK